MPIRLPHLAPGHPTTLQLGVQGGDGARVVQAIAKMLLISPTSHQTRWQSIVRTLSYDWSRASLHVYAVVCDIIDGIFFRGSRLSPPSSPRQFTSTVSLSYKTKEFDPGIQMPSVSTNRTVLHAPVELKSGTYTGMTESPTKPTHADTFINYTAAPK